MKSKGNSEITVFLNSHIFNMFLIFIGTIIALFFASKAYMPESSNHGGILPYFKAILFSIITLIAYLSLKPAFKNYSWVITIIGIIITIIVVKA